MLTYLTKGNPPVTRNEAKAHLRLDTPDDDTYVDALIATATELIESETNVDLRTTTAKLVLRGFPSDSLFGVLTVPRVPLVSVQSIKYFDPSIVEQTLDPTWYYVATPSRTWGFITPQPLHYWPPTYARADAVTVTFTSGSSSFLVAKHAILLAIGTWYENRESETEASLYTLGLGFDRLLNQLRVVQA